MKFSRIAAVMLLALFLSLAFIPGAFAQEVRPVPVDHDRIDLANGEFCLSVRNADRVRNGGYFIAVLYRKDCYDRVQILSLAPGDTVLANDQVWTVKEVVIHPGEESADQLSGIEVYPEEELDGYLVFLPCEDGSFLALMNDWNPVVLLGSVQVRLPLPDDFAYFRVSGGGEKTAVTAQDFLEDLAPEEGSTAISAYNTTCVFRDGLLLQVVSADYPQGPDVDENAVYQPVPVWKFCHGLRDGLDTAVITGYTTDCEEGVLPAELTPEEAESIRRLAMNSRITGKASDEMVTGGTWVYSFETPGGKHLLSIEMYKGMIVGSDGMYRFGP